MVRGGGVSSAEVNGESMVQPHELRELFLFEDLDSSLLEAVAENSVRAEYDTGVIAAEGERALFFFVLEQGEISLSKRVGDRDVETTRTSHRGAYCGATASYLEKPPPAYGFTVRATKPAKILRIDGHFLGTFIRTHYPMAVHLLQGMMVDHEGVHQIIGQQHRIDAAATLAAGLMHGLNNPAGAIARIASQLRHDPDTVSGGTLLRRLSPHGVAAYDRIVSELGDFPLAGSPAATALQHVQLEEQLHDWLLGHGVQRPWEFGPILAAARLTPSWLETVVTTLELGDALNDFETVVAAVAGYVDRALLLDELATASAEVSALVGSAQQYSQLDVSCLTECDVNELLESTLTMLSGLLPDGIAVSRHYASNLPPLLCYASELNQAWTNIIVNAADAIRATDDARGTIAVCTGLDDHDVIRVEIRDSGIGVDNAILDRIFLPFFTTKPVGQGVGMGLDLAWRTVVGQHRGALTVTSEPADTRFTIRLPVNGCQLGR
jgi:signal transduction histidine kinase